MTKLEGDALKEQLNDLPQWVLNEAGKLERTLKFKDFKQAFAFMTQVALEAESKNHHPEWHNVYNAIKIELMTHDVGGVTEKDFSLANYINQAASLIV